MQTGRVTYWATGPATAEREGVEVEPIGSGEMLRRAVLASASEPVFLPLVRVKEGGEQHADGGVRELEPLKIAIQSGADEIYAVVMEPQRRTPSSPSRTSATPPRGGASSRSTSSTPSGSCP